MKINLNKILLLNCYKLTIHVLSTCVWSYVVKIVKNNPLNKKIDKIKKKYQLAKGGLVKILDAQLYTSRIRKLHIFFVNHHSRCLFR